MLLFMIYNKSRGGGAFVFQAGTSENVSLS